MMSKVWMMVTKDDIQLPLAVASSAEELARITGKSANSIWSAVTRKHKKTSYVCVEVDDDDDE